MRQPYIYTMPEGFIHDDSVPARWRVLALINGFHIAGKEFWGSNAWIQNELKCSEQTVSNAFKELEALGEIVCTRTRRSRLVSRNMRDHNWLGSETLTDSPRDPNWLGTISDSNSDKEFTSVAIAPQIVEVLEESESPSKKKPKYPNACTVFSWFPNPQKSWALNTTECKHAELLFIRGEEQVSRALAFIRENKEDTFCPTVVKPSDLERKWLDLIEYRNKNGL